jgi:glycosyltransferase involved in cell wall biosynthesis
VRKKIFVRAPCLSQSGYGEQSRFALRALRSREDIFDIYIQPIPWGQTGWVWEDNEFRQWLDTRIAETQILLQDSKLQPDVSLQITIPNEFEKLCAENIGYTAGIETDRVAPVWLQKGNDVDKILVVSNHSKNSYQNTKATATNKDTGETFPYKLETPVEVVWESTPREDAIEIPGFEPMCDFNFLMVSQISPRKNFANAVKWWVEEFIDQDVGLIIKTNTRGNSRIDLDYTESSLRNMLKDYPDRKCKVQLLHADLSPGQMNYLYNHPKSKVIINIAHGEGFGLPLFEAAREGLPIITINWSGQVDFLRYDSKNYFQEVKCSIDPVQPEAIWEGVIQTDSKWAFADQGSYKMILRKSVKQWDKLKDTADELKGLIDENFNNKKLYEGFCSHFYNEEEEDLEQWLNTFQVKEYE